MIPLERRITDKIMADLKAGDGFWMKTHGGAMQVAGVPDIIGVRRGYFFAFEVKRPQLGRATVLQLAVLNKIWMNGGICAIVTSPEDVKAVIENYAFQERPGQPIENFEVFMRTWYNVG